MTRILLLDIETYPQLGWSWTSYETNIIAVEKHWRVCCVTAQWLGSEPVTLGIDTVSEKRLLTAIRDDLDTADVVIAHNGDNFDLRKLNSRFIVHKITPPSAYRTVDTCKLARRIFGFTSNKLDSLCEQLGIGRKINTEGFSLWQKCMAKDPAAWERMKEYNAHDVVLLEGLYTRLLPWIGQNPKPLRVKDIADIRAS